MSCLADQTILDFVDHRIDDDARARVEAHVESCDGCRRLVAATVLSVFPSSSEPPAPAALRRGASVGRYVLVEAIGAGSMGVVYSAFDPELHREVALKLVRTREEPRERNARVLREARAMAKLSHPNVIPVFDVGAFGDEVFVAMELVRGKTLRSWLEQSPRDWRSILTTYVQAGRGLAAAHEVGIVHRDFKPDNVLVGDDGRVRVTDFGLARSQELATAPTTAADREAAASATGAAGTPAYMAPEQARGRVDAASDQFAFSVALYEALYGQHPFAKDPTLRHRTPSFPSAAGIPSRVRRALARGLRFDPSERHGSMNAMLASLEAPVVGRPRSIAIAGSMGAVALAMTFGARAQPPPASPACTGADEMLIGVWDGPRRDAVSTALHATGKSFADDTWRTVAETLDDYARDWKAERRDACEATRVRGEQSEAVLDERMECLDRRLIELRALGGVLSRADEGVLEKAAQSTMGLTPLAVCSPLALRQDVEAPVDATVGEALAEAKALRATGQLEAAERSARAALDRSRALGEPQAAADALAELAEISFFQFEGPLTEQRAFDALEAAETLGRTALVAHAELRLGWATGVYQSRPVDADRWFRLATSTLDRLGEEADPDRAKVLTGRAYTLRHAGEKERAAAQARLAIGFLQARLPGNWNDLASARNALASALDDLDQPEEAEQSAQAALESAERALGPMHPLVGTLLGNLAIEEINQGHCDEALRDTQRTVAIPDLPSRIGALAWSTRSDALARKGLFTESHTAIDRALAIAGSSDSVEPRDLADLYAQKGDVERLEGRDADAAADLKLALATMDRALGPHHPDSVGAACDLGIVYADQGLTSRAIAQLEDALSLAPSRAFCIAGPYALAQALWETGRDRPRARALVRQERAYFRDHPGRAGEVRRWDLWFSKHAPELGDDD
jgi:tetratricopeptide (TPR) repeat protein/predicted Ser/Thr protein kinase